MTARRLTRLTRVEDIADTLPEGTSELADIVLPYIDTFAEHRVTWRP